MLRLRDLVLLAVVFGSMAAGVYWPDECRRLGPFLPALLMAVLFQAFLKVFPHEIFSTARRYAAKLGGLVLAKLVVMPVVVFFLAKTFLPADALGLMLLAGVSTGLSAPFFSGYIEAHIPLVLAMTVTTTLLLPVSLPLIVKVLIGQNLQINLIGLALFLSAMIFVPLVASMLSRRLLPKASAWLDRQMYPISLVLFAGMNLGAFGLYAPFLREHLSQVVSLTLLGCALAAFLSGAGLLLFWSSPDPERSAAAGSLGWINNVLVIVLGQYFNDPVTSVLAALYLVPYYALIIPLGYLAGGGLQGKKFRDKAA
jgi:bile acid:Na+ symporter, BASS family